MIVISSRKYWLGTLSGLFLLGSMGAVATEEKRVCEFGDVTIRSDFSGGRLNGCKQLSPLHYALTIAPEDEPPINPSPWYAFTIEADAPSDITIDLQYTAYKHRYWPKLSVDGKAWQRIADDKIELLEDGSARLDVSTGDGLLHVSGQEILATDFHKQWAEETARKFELDFNEIGRSRDGRPIYQIASPSADDITDFVFIIGRQHPPEVTGALALTAFVEEMLVDSELSRAFLSEFRLIVVPMLNPDGVERGHWRHNTDGQDLNRDWGPFSQPETQLMRDTLERFAGGEERLWLFLDFHSTGRNVLYTQADDEQTVPAMFARRWSDRVAANPHAYEFEHAERPLTDLPTSKNYVFSKFGVPSITYEVGDHTDRRDIDVSARIFAQEMMKILLEDKKAAASDD